MSKEEIDKKALEYHSKAPAGKIFTGLSKNAETQEDLVLAYSPGVAAPCLEIEKDINKSFIYTGRGNLVGVVSNGTAVLGLGNIGPDAAKPVMEGKAMLFKKFADIDVFDIELKCDSVADFIKTVKSLEPTFGAINLEDIKAPECFEIEKTLKEEMNIPVFHDDQHGTAIIAGAAFLNALEITKRKISETKVVISGAGAAAIACANLFILLGIKKDNVIMCDSKGVISTNRKDLNAQKQEFARDTKLTTLNDALAGADAFLGVSKGNILNADNLIKMNKNPIIFALANPEPEIMPDVARKIRKDAIIATGRSDFPNQVNNVLGFPFIFRGALDVRATQVNDAMKLAAVRAISDLAKSDVPDQVMEAYSAGESYSFGRDYLIPKPIDPRVLFSVAPAVAQAAMESGVAKKIIDIEKYKIEIERVLGPAQKVLNQLKSKVKKSVNRTGKIPTIVIPNAFHKRVIRGAVQAVSECKIKVILLGHKEDILKSCAELGIKDLRNIEIIDPVNSKKSRQYCDDLFELRKRKGVSRTHARQLMRNHSYFAAMMVYSGNVDGMISGIEEPYSLAIKPVLEVIGTQKNKSLAGIYMVMIANKKYFFSDCTININPDAQTLANIAITTVEVAKGYTKDELKVAMLSYASFGASKSVEAKKVGHAVKIIQNLRPDIVVEGEMAADIALDEEKRNKDFPFSKLSGCANILIFPNLSAANICYKLLASLAKVDLIGPILVGVNNPVHIMQMGATANEIRDLIYLTAAQIVD